MFLEELSIRLLDVLFRYILYLYIAGLVRQIQQVDVCVPQLFLFEANPNDGVIDVEKCQKQTNKQT